MNGLLTIIDYGPPLLCAMVVGCVLGTIWYFHERHILRKEERRTRDDEVKLRRADYEVEAHREWLEHGFDAWLELWEREQEQSR